MNMCKIFGHKMQPRYNSRLPEGLTRLRGYMDVEQVEALKTKTYVHDICVRCGLIIKGEMK